MIATVPALATASTAQESACEGALSGTQLSPSGFCPGATCSTCSSNASFSSCASSAAGPWSACCASTADRVDHPVYARAAGQPDDGLDRVFLVKVDDFSALCPGHLEAVLMSVYSDDAARAHELGA